MEEWSEQFEETVRTNLLSAEPDVQLTPTTSLASLQLDSLSVMALVTALECSFKTTLPPSALVHGLDTTLGDLWFACVGSNTRSSAA